MHLHLQGTPGSKQTGVFTHPNEHVSFLHTHTHTVRRVALMGQSDLITGKDDIRMILM